MTGSGLDEPGNFVNSDIAILHYFNLNQMSLAQILTEKMCVFVCLCVRACVHKKIIAQFT